MLRSVGRVGATWRRGRFCGADGCWSSASSSGVVRSQSPEGMWWVDGWSDGSRPEDGSRIAQVSGVANANPQNGGTRDRHREQQTRETIDDWHALRMETGELGNQRPARAA